MYIINVKIKNITNVLKVFCMAFSGYVLSGDKGQGGPTKESKPEESDTWYAYLYNQLPSSSDLWNAIPSASDLWNAISFDSIYNSIANSSKTIYAGANELIDKFGEYVKERIENTLTKYACDYAVLIAKQNNEFIGEFAQHNLTPNNIFKEVFEILELPEGQQNLSFQQVSKLIEIIKAEPDLLETSNCISFYSEEESRLCCEMLETLSADKTHTATQVLAKEAKDKVKATLSSIVGCAKEKKLSNKSTRDDVNRLLLDENNKVKSNEDDHLIACALLLINTIKFIYECKLVNDNTLDKKDSTEKDRGADEIIKKETGTLEQIRVTCWLLKHYLFGDAGENDERKRERQNRTKIVVQKIENLTKSRDDPYQTCQEEMKKCTSYLHGITNEKNALTADFAKKCVGVIARMKLANAENHSFLVAGVTDAAKKVKEAANAAKEVAQNAAKAVKASAQRAKNAATQLFGALFGRENAQKDQEQQYAQKEQPQQKQDTKHKTKENNPYLTENRILYLKHELDILVKDTNDKEEQEKLKTIFRNTCQFVKCRVDQFESLDLFKDRLESLKNVFQTILPAAPVNNVAPAVSNQPTSSKSRLKRSDANLGSTK